MFSRQDEIFASGFSKESIRAASYELRIANTKCILPEGKRIPEGEVLDGALILGPGGVAFVSTEERFHMPRNLSANLAVKFTYASKGILSLNGFTVDPGYGSDEDKGSRLHFILANVGSETVTIQPLVDRFASIQFLPVIEFEDSQEVPLNITKVPTRIAKLFSDENASLGLSFFKDQATLKGRIDNLETTWHKEIKALDNVVYFGFFLLGATILGVVLSVTAGLMSRMGPTLHLISQHLVVAIVLMIFIVTLLTAVPYSIVRTISFARTNRKHQSSDVSTKCP